MKKQIAIAALAMTISTGAMAGERATSAALGAVSGAVVLGPVGAVAGAFIGYTAGPSMSRAWGVSGSSRSASSRHQRRTASSGERSYRESQAALPPPAPAPQPAAKAAPKAPAVQPLE
jgi:hypothetical protein